MQTVCSTNEIQIFRGTIKDSVFQIHWIPFFDEVHVLGRVGYDLETESADFHFTWHRDEHVLMVHPPYRWLQDAEGYAEHAWRFAYANAEMSEERVDAVPYYRYPHTKDGTTLLEILEVLFGGKEGIPHRIFFL